MDSRQLTFQMGDVVDTPRGVGSVMEIKGALYTVMLSSGQQFVYHREDLRKILGDMSHLKWTLGLYNIGDRVKTPDGEGIVWNIYHEGPFYFVFVRFPSGLCVKYGHQELRLL